MVWWGSILVLVSLLCYGCKGDTGSLGFKFSSFSRDSRSYVTLAGSSQFGNSGVIDLTRNVTQEAGAVWVKQRVWVDEFICNFTFRVSGNRGRDGADGVALVFWGSPKAPTSDSVAPVSGGLGYGNGLDGDSQGSGLAWSVAVEVDTHYDPTLHDPMQLHVAVHSRGQLPNSANESSAQLALGTSNLPKRIMENVDVTVAVTYKGGYLSVFLDPFTQPTIVANVDLVSLSNANGDRGGVFAGVTASTGTDTVARHSLAKWQFSYTGNRLSMTNSRVSGPGWDVRRVVAGTVQTFYINALDVFNHSYYGPNVFTAFAGATPLQVTAVTTDPSMYKVTFVGTTQGKLVLRVLANGLLLNTTSTFVDPGPFDPFNSSLEGQYEGGTVGNMYDFTLNTNDAYGNRVSSPGAVISVTYNGTGPAASPQPCGSCNGAYTVQYQSSVQGVFQMTVTVNNIAIKGSPFIVAFSSGAVSPFHCTVQGDGVAGGVAGSPITFIVQLRDQYHNPVTTSANVSVTVTDEEGVAVAGPVVTVENTPGEYEVTWSTKVAGYYQYLVTVNGVEINESPVTLVRVQSEPNAVAELSRVQYARTAMVGTTMAWVFVAVDSYNNTLWTLKCPFQIRITQDGGDSVNTTSPLMSSAPGTWLIYYAPQDTTSVQVNVLLNDQPLPGSPFVTTVVAGDVSVGESVASGTGLGVTQTTGQGATFNLVLRDVSGNPVLTHKAPVTVSMTGPKNVQIHVSPLQGNGRYVVQYTLPQDGLYVLSVNVMSGPFADMPLAQFPRAILAVPPDATVSSETVVSIVTACVATVGWALLLLAMALRGKIRARLSREYARIDEPEVEEGQQPFQEEEEEEEEQGGEQQKLLK